MLSYHSVPSDSEETGALRGDSARTGLAVTNLLQS